MKGDYFSSFKQVANYILIQIDSNRSSDRFSDWPAHQTEALNIYSNLELLSGSLSLHSQNAWLMRV